MILALLSALGYWIFAYDLERSEFTKLISLAIVLFIFCYLLISKFGWNFWLLAGIGIVFRCLFIPAIPSLSQDFFRFLWDGRLVLQGVNPYLFTPETYISGAETLQEVSMPQAQILYNGMGSLSASHFSNYPGCQIL